MFLIYIYLSLATQGETLLIGDEQVVLDLTSDDFDLEFDAHYGLLAPEQTVLVRAYSDDTDDQMLWEIQPRFIIMFEPNQDFVRRVEVRIGCSYSTNSLLMWVAHRRCIAALALGSVCGCTSWCTRIAAKNTST